MSLDFDFNLNEGQQFSVSGAFLVYSDGSKTMVTRHPVLVRRQDADSGSEPTIEIGPGSVVGLDAVTDLAEKLERSSMRGGFLDGRVLAADAARTIWWVPRSIRPIWFDGEAGKAASELSGRPAPHPGLIFHASDRGLRVYVHNGMARPEPGDRLFVAPYPNVSPTGIVCLGSAMRPSGHTTTYLGGWETCWFDSAFTHSNARSQKLTNHPGGVVALWKHLTATDARSFPETALVEAGITLADLIAWSGARAEDPVSPLHRNRAGAGARVAG